MTNLLDNVNNLILKKVGDSSRLEHIKESIEHNKPLYESDKNYVEDLIKKYLLSNKQKDEDVKNSTTQKDISCVKCGANLELNSNFCPKCGFSVISSVTEEKNSSANSKDQKKQSESNVLREIPREVIEREESIVNAVAVSIIGIIVLLGGAAITIGSLSMPMIFAGQYMILGLFVMVIGGLILYGGKRLIKKKKSHFVCGYCGFIAETERELYNHSLLCEKKKLEEEKQEHHTESSCRNCTAILSDESNFCINCGTPTYSNTESQQSQTQHADKFKVAPGPASKLWYLAPIFFGIIGGLIAYFSIRKDSTKIAKNCLIIGIVIFIISLIVIMASFGSNL